MFAMTDLSVSEGDSVMTQVELILPTGASLERDVVFRVEATGGTATGIYMYIQCTCIYSVNVLVLYLNLYLYVIHVHFLVIEVKSSLIYASCKYSVM